jgi:LCP family protein required for cell wall assembly
MLSFPRDLYINIPGWGTQRINTAFPHGGFKLMQDTFQQNFGIRPDHYMLINFSAFKHVVDGLGGLNVNVAKDVSDYRSGRWYTVHAGKQFMNADTVLWYVRTRKTTNDFQRNQRQQEVLLAIGEKLLSMNGLTRIPELFNLYRQYVTTDLAFTDVVPLLPMATRVKDASIVKRYAISPREAYDWITYDGAMVLLPQMDAIQELVRKTLNIP